MRVTSGAIAATIAFDRIEPGFARAELRFEGMKPPLQSFAARAFVDEPHATIDTPTEGNSRYLGTQYFYGLGTADAEPDRSDPYRLGRSSQSARTQIRLNVTQAVRAYLAGTVPHPAPISFVTVDAEGNEIDEPDFDVEGISLITT
ncbi:MAG: hypothetical protein NVS3B17_20020 [Vulcanimicrobiaceae bacterium]